MPVDPVNPRARARTACAALVTFASPAAMTVWAVGLAVALWAASPAQAQPRKDTLVLAMTLEPPGLDPTAGAASAIAEITLYNVYETLTKIGSDSRITGLLAESWTACETPARRAAARAWTCAW